MAVLAETIDLLIKWLSYVRKVRLYCMECTFATGYLSRDIVRQKYRCGLLEIYMLSEINLYQIKIFR